MQSCNLLKLSPNTCILINLIKATKMRVQMMEINIYSEVMMLRET
jgi:carbamoylphosphate synthase large subunit